MAIKSFAGVLPRVPPPSPGPDGLQANFCKNVECKNYGVPASPVYKKPPEKDNYQRTGGTKRDAVLRCKECNVYFTVKSNQGIVEEAARLESYMHEKPPVRGCPVETCPNHDKDVSEGSRYYVSWGRTRCGSAKYRCRACKRYFSINDRTTFRQKKPEKNEMIFLGLVNKGAVNRIFEMVRTGGGTVYGKIDFFYKQCRLFAAHQERQLLEASRVGFPRLYLCTDAQEYSINWKYHHLKQNVKLTGVGTADDWSGFVFAMNLNFDPNSNPAATEAETIANGDYDKPNAFRRYAQYWLRQDYLDAVDELLAKMRKVSPGRKQWTRKPPDTLIGKIRRQAREAGRRRNVDNSQDVSMDITLPDQGMQVARDYLYFGHFYFLKRLFADNFGKLRFFFDYDSGLRAACLTVFANEIKARRADACYVTVAYGMRKGAKTALIRQWRKEYDQIKAKHPKLTHDAIETMLMVRQIKNKQSDQYWGDSWINHPHPSYNEPMKMMSFQTYHRDLGVGHFARLLRKASLHGINQFFNFVRNRVSVLSRQGTPASTQSREFLTHGAYSPTVVMKYLEILRVYYNYVLPVREHKEYTDKMKKRGIIKERYYIPVKERKSRAMYLGLCDRLYTIQDILEFKPPEAEQSTEISA